MKKNLKLTNLSEIEVNSIVGGDAADDCSGGGGVGGGGSFCGCGCAWENCGGSSTIENGVANNEGDLDSPQVLN